MTEDGLYRALGLMSGTSLDGVDVALIETDGEHRVTTGPGSTYPYPPELRDAIRGCLGGERPPGKVEDVMTEFHAAAVEALLDAGGFRSEEIDVVGFHGHTILHMPEARRTWQIGNGRLLAHRIGIDVVNDFRSADVAAGGQGAPFASLYHAALAAGLEKPLAVLNIGGVANVTWIGENGAILAFDTGPGNALIDDLVFERNRHSHDQDGRLAAAGKVDEGVLRTLLSDPYFKKSPPKSLDRDAWNTGLLTWHRLEDAAATLTAFTVAAVGQSRDHFPAPPVRWLVTGGGRHNPTMMDFLARQLSVPVEPVEAAGWDGDSLEAQAFAYLAVRSLKGLPLSVPGTTGVPRPMTGGKLHRAA